VIVLDDGRVTEIMDAHQPPTGPLRFRLAVRTNLEALRTAFPSAEPDPGAGGPPGPDAPSDPAAPDVREFLVQTADASELSHRLAALLDSGAIVHAVTPVTEDLETRVRQRLEDG